MGFSLAGLVDLGAEVFGAGDILGLGSLLGLGGDAAAAGTAAGLGTDIATTAGLTGGLADLAGPTALGTASAFLDPAAAAASSLAGPTVAGTIADTLGAGAAAGAGGTLAAAAPFALDSSVFSTGAAPVFDSSGISGVVGGAGGAGPAGTSISQLLSANASAPGAGPGSSVFQTGTSAVPGVNTAGAPSAVPAGGGAAASAAPSSVSAPVDATSAAAGTTTGAGAGAAPQSTIQQLLSGAGKSLTNNPLGVALGAAGLGYNILQGQKQTGNQKALTADAQQATANSDKLVGQGEALQQYLTNGTLPPAYQQIVDQAIADAKTAAISNAASQGLSTDPTQNTALAQTLAKIDASRAGMQTQVASQLASSGQGLINAGQSAAGLSGQLYQSLVQNDTTSAANTGKAIATLAAALNGRSSNTFGGTNIQVSQAA